MQLNDIKFSDGRRRTDSSFLGMKSGCEVNDERWNVVDRIAMDQSCER